MVLNTVTLRIAFGVMALVLVVLVVLSYFSPYCVTRAPYSGWWCVALVFFLGRRSRLSRGRGHRYLTRIARVVVLGSRLFPVRVLMAEAPGCTGPLRTANPVPDRAGRGLWMRGPPAQTAGLFCTASGSRPQPRAGPAAW